MSLWSSDEAIDSLVAEHLLEEEEERAERQLVLTNLRRQINFAQTEKDFKQVLNLMLDIIEKGL